MRRESLLVVLTFFLVGVGLSLLVMNLQGRRSTSRPGPAGGGVGDVSRQSVPRRIICMAPNITEAVFALGCGDRVAGVTDFTMYPPEAKTKPCVGSAFRPNLERIVAAAGQCFNWHPPVA